MITIITGQPRVGKTCLMTHLANGIAFDETRTTAMQDEIRQKIANGFTGIETIPTHCVSGNYDMTLNRFRYSTRVNRRINPYRLGFKNPYVQTHFNIPYEAIFITEAQKYLNSRRSSMFPDWQSRWYEQHGHNYIDLFLDTQRGQLIDLNVRALAQFLEILKLDILDYDRYGKPAALRWKVRHMENNFAFERYMESGASDKRCYDEYSIIAEYNVFDCYDSRCCKPKFYDGHLKDNFDYSKAEPPKESYDGYVKWLKDNDDELPDGFYQKKQAA